MSARTRNWIEWIGSFGHLARMVVFGLIGVFPVKAAIDYNPNTAVGRDRKLRVQSTRHRRRDHAASLRPRADVTSYAAVVRRLSGAAAAGYLLEISLELHQPGGSPRAVQLNRPEIDHPGPGARHARRVVAPRAR